MKPDRKFLEEPILIRIDKETFEFRPTGYWGLIGGTIRSFFSGGPDFEMFMENRLDKEETLELIRSTICSDIYYPTNNEEVFWEEKTFERDWNYCPFLFRGLTNFFYWLSVTTDDFIYERDFKRKVLEFLQIFPEPNLLFEIFEDKMKKPVFNDAFILLVGVFHRGSDYHKEIIKKQEFKVYIEPERIGFSEKQILEKKIELQRIETEHEKLKAQRLEMDQLVQDLKKRLEDLNEKNVNLEKEIEKRAKEIVDSTLPGAIDQIKKENQKNLFEEIFAKPHSDQLSKSDIFEKEEAEKERRRKEEEMDRREFKSEVREGIYEQGKKIDDVKHDLNSYVSSHEAKHAEESHNIGKEIMAVRYDAERLRADMELKFVKTESKFAHLDANMAVLRSYIDSISLTVNTRIDKEMTNVAQNIAAFKLEVQKSLSGIEVEFANRDVRFREEILNLNENQMKIVNYLEKLAAQTEAFKTQLQNEMYRALIEIDKKGISFEKIQQESVRLLDKTESLQRNFQVDNRMLKQDLEHALGQLELEKGTMFVELSKQKTMLERSAIEVYHASKEIALGQIGLEHLYNEKLHALQNAQDQLNLTQREIASKEKMMHLMADNDRLKIQYSNQVASLQQRSMFDNDQLQRQKEQLSFYAQELRKRGVVNP